MAPIHASNAVLIILALTAIQRHTQVNAITIGPKGTVPEDNHPMAQFTVLADFPWLFAVIQFILSLPGVAIIVFKVFVSTRKVAAHDYYRFAAWFLGSVLFNTILQGIVMPFATSDCTPEKASILVTGLGILAFTGHVLLYSYSLDRLFIVWPNLKKYSRLRPLVAGIISIPGFLMYAVGYNYDGPMSEIIESCSTTPNSMWVNVQAAVVIVCEITFLLAFLYPIVNVKRHAGSMKLSVKMIGIIERLSIQYVVYFTWLILSVVLFNRIARIEQPVLAQDRSNIEYIRYIRFGWARAGTACGVGLAYLSVYALWISDALTVYQRNRNRDSFIWANEASFQTFMQGKTKKTSTGTTFSVSPSSSPSVPGVYASSIMSTTGSPDARL